MLSSSPIRKILTGMGVCATTCLLAAVTYHAAGWTWLDSAYMVIITVFGIGYGEVNPIVDPLLKLQTMALIVVGGLSGLFSIGGFLQLVTEGEIKRTMGAHKMSRELKKMKNHTIICGFGRIGQTLALELTASELPFVIVDTSPSRLESAASMGYTTVSGDASQDEVLLLAGIEDASSLASVLPDDAINVFITLSAREMNPQLEIIARAENPATERKLRRSGAHHVVMPASIGAVRIAQIISGNAQCQTTDDPKNTQKLRLLQVPVTCHEGLEESTLELAQLTVAELGRIVGVQRADCSINTDLDLSSRLTPEDVLLIAQS